MNHYLSAKEVKTKYKITSQTLHNWRLAGKIEFVRLPSGKIVYTPIEQIQPTKKKNVLYARVSNTKQKDDLSRQISLLRSFMVSNGVVVDDEFSDIASGMNESRINFNKLLQQCFSGEVGRIYVTYKDRLTRFGYGYVETMLKLCDVEIVVVNATSEEDFQQELTQDLVSIIHHFSMKMYSNRRKMLKELETAMTNDLNTDTK